MSIHISVGLAQLVFPPNKDGDTREPQKDIRVGVCTMHGQQDTEVLLSCKDARMVAAMLATAADELEKQIPKG